MVGGVWWNGVSGLVGEVGLLREGLVRFAACRMSFPLFGVL